MPGRPASGGGRWVLVPPERLGGWLERFAATHGGSSCEGDDQTVTFTGADGAVATCHVPFPPLIDGADSIVEHTLVSRHVGVLLVRLGGYAAGVFDGTNLMSSKVGSRQVHGRSAAGGWSQQRFARRREGQVQVALGEAADVAARILLPEASSLEGLVLGGDRRATAAVLADPRLEPLRALVVEPHLDVPDPRLKVLEQTPQQFRGVRIRVTDPA